MVLSVKHHLAGVVGYLSLSGRGSAFLLLPLTVIPGGHREAQAVFFSLQSWLHS